MENRCGRIFKPLENDIHTTNVQKQCHCIHNICAKSLRSRLILIETWHIPFEYLHHPRTLRLLLSHTYHLPSGRPTVRRPQPPRPPPSSSSSSRPPACTPATAATAPARRTRRPAATRPGRTRARRPGRRSPGWPRSRRCSAH